MYILYISSPVACMVIHSHADCLVILVASQECNQLHSPDLSREPSSGIGTQEWHHPAQTCTIPPNVSTVQLVTATPPLTSQPPYDKVAFLDFNNQLA
jgi:hypothetical protein